MSSISDTSTWLKFFTEAGIPAGEATNYAIIFTDNRIKQDMLMDLNREYLRDMGITVMGDIIAILKHAKIFSGHLSRQRVLQASSPQTPQYDTSASHSSSKKSTPASRMLEHYVRKEGPPSPPNGNSSLSQSLSARLSSGNKRSVEDDDSSSANKRSSVFNRLGDNSVTSTTSETPKITITMHGKDIIRTATGTESNKKSSPSVFGRLGSKDDNTKGGASDHELSPGKPLEYQGILKYSSSDSFDKPSFARKKVIAIPGGTKVATMTADTTTGIKSRLGLQSITSNSSCTSAGIFARETAEARKSKSPAKSTTSSSISSSRLKTKASTSKSSNLKLKASPSTSKETPLPGRTVVSAAATSSSPSLGKKYVKKIVKVNKKTGEIVSEEKILLKTDVFSRLGN
ncbi:uncharacterized protein C19orf47 [Procambarus clarkii]|uniref:uncharacterized protein C19orf47 n=1 Tax=Procambarus clarkii TaxID=6728 RepID=UPI001E672CF8|nr:uncharacterized protein C19orf47-like [Procambarus clarkii]